MEGALNTKKIFTIMIKVAIENIRGRCEVWINKKKTTN